MSAIRPGKTTGLMPVFIAVFALVMVMSPIANVNATSLGYLKDHRSLAQRKTFAEPRLLSKSQAAAIATSRHGGKVLKVESTDTKGNYRVRLLLESGRIKTSAKQFLCLSQASRSLDGHSWEAA